MVDQGNEMTRKLLDLMQRTGYSIVQHNGQRKFGPPPCWVGPPPQKGCEVFIGKLPRDIFEDELVPLFSSVGKIYEMRLMMDFSGSNRGYAFVTFSTRAEASAAVRDLNGYEIRPGRQIGVVKSVDNCRLFIGGIPKTKSRDEIFEELSKRVAGVVDVILYKNCFDRRLNRGFAFVEFTTHRAAAMARRALVPGCVRLWEHEVMVDWAEPEPDIDDDQMKKHFDKREYANSPKEDEGIGSGGAGDSQCGSPESKTWNSQITAANDNYALAPAKLESMCKRYMWPAPIYENQKYIDPTGAIVWICKLELPQVGLPLVAYPQRIGPFVTRPCFSVQQTQIEAAEIALHHIKLLQRSAHPGIQPPIQPPVQSQPVYSPCVSQVANCVSVPYDYVSQPLYQTPHQMMPMTMQTLRNRFENFRLF